MRIIVQSLEQIEHIAPEVTYAIISISDPDNNKTVMQKLSDLVSDAPLHEGTLYQEFHDIIEPYHDFTLFTEQQARDIIDFVDELKKAETNILFIHCHAGISRSAAVASAIQSYLGNNVLGMQYWQSPLFAPNPHVYRTIMKHIGKYNEEELTLLQTMSIHALEEWSLIQNHE